MTTSDLTLDPSLPMEQYHRRYVARFGLPADQGCAICRALEEERWGLTASGLVALAVSVLSQPGTPSALDISADVILDAAPTDGVEWGGRCWVPVR